LTKTMTSNYSINAHTSRGTKHSSFDKKPNSCPHCFTTIDAPPHSGYIAAGSKLRIVYSCTNEDCLEIFIGNYEEHAEESGHYAFIDTSFGNPRKSSFPDTIAKISPNFIEIYNESFEAEQLGIRHLAGPGYRKSLEFLIKDYLVEQDPDNANDIKKKFLGKCIEENLDNARIKSAAKRAYLIGNDETHYEKRLNDKDIEDLKTLIKICVDFIDMNIRLDQYEEAIPD